MIHARVSRNPDNAIAEIHISVTADSLPNFQKLVDKALNCWDSAPAEIKELGDMLTHGHITQDHTYRPMNTKQSGDYYNPKEQAIIKAFIESEGYGVWLQHVANGTIHKVLNQDTESATPKD